MTNVVNDCNTSSRPFSYGASGGFQCWSDACGGGVKVDLVVTDLLLCDVCDLILVAAEEANCCPTSPMAGTFLAATEFSFAVKHNTAR
jgi:hypothetical protein